MNHPDDDGQPTFVPDDTRELSVGEKIENGDLKWHQSANEWTEIQTLGYRMVKASQKGLYRRFAIALAVENEPDSDVARPSAGCEQIPGEPGHHHGQQGAGISDQFGYGEVKPA